MCKLPNEYATDRVERGMGGGDKKNFVEASLQQVVILMSLANFIKSRFNQLRTSDIFFRYFPD